VTYSLRRVRRFVVPAAIALLLGLILPSQANAGAKTVALRTWALQSENPGAGAPTATVPEDQAIADAEHFDYILAHPAAYRDSVDEMQEANRRLKLLVYMNGTFAQKRETDYPEDAYAHTAEGERIYARGTGNWLMNPSSAYWRQSRVEQCQRKLADSGYQACYLDMLGTAQLSPGYASGTAVNPDTDEPWTAREWLAATSGIAATVRDLVEPKLVIGNGLNNGPTYFATTRSLLSSMDGGVAEAFLRAPRARVDAYPSVNVWKQNVDMIADAEAQSRAVLTMTKLWVSATQEQKDSWRQFALASYLLASKNHSSFTFSDDPAADRTLDHPWHETVLGSPRGDYTLTSGAYQRKFSKGRVLVNPTSSTVTVPLDTRYYTLSRERVTTLTMAPHTGVLLTER
jgi:hypothetical protein